MGAAWCWKSHDKALVKLAKELSIGIEPQYYNGLAVIQDSNGMLQYRQDISPSGEGSFRFPNGTNSVIQKLENEILNQNMDVNADMCESENGEMTILNPCEIKLCHKVVRIVKLNPNSSSNIENYPRYMISTVYQNNNADMNLNLKADVVIFAMPPKNIGEIHLEPALPPNRMQAMANTPIWMSGTGKVVFIYNKPFWRENGFSGTVFSHTGPLVQIWDSCGKQGDEEVYALSSFIFDNFDLLSNSNDGSMSQDEVLCSRSPIMTQMVNIFGEQAGNPIKMHYKVWELNPKPDPSSYELPFGSPLISAPHEGLIFSGDIRLLMRISSELS